MGSSVQERSVEGVRNQRADKWAFAVLFAFFVIVAALGFSLFAPGRPGLSKQIAAGKTKRVLLIGIDGCRTDALLAAKIPNLRALIKEGCLCENTEILGTRQTNSDTLSGPGWSSILTGVWADKHGVLDNTFGVTKFKEFPDFFQRIKEKNPLAFTMSISDWPAIHREIAKNASLSESFDDPPEDDYATHDEQVTKRACKLVTERNPKAIFLYFGNVDETGHKHGFHPKVKQYAAAIETVDQQIGRFLTSLRSRPTYANEDWLIMVCTDHGGREKDHGKGHGYPEIRRVFMILSGDSAPKKPDSEATYLVDIVPTLLTHLGIVIDPAWKLDGRSLLEKPAAENSPKERESKQ